MSGEEVAVVRGFIPNAFTVMTMVCPAETEVGRVRLRVWSVRVAVVGVTVPPSRVVVEDRLYPGTILIWEGICMVAVKGLVRGSVGVIVIVIVTDSVLTW